MKIDLRLPKVLVKMKVTDFFLRRSIVKVNTAKKGLLCISMYVCLTLSDKLSLT